MKRFISIYIGILLPIICSAQMNDDFQAFRKGLLNDYQGFRKSVLDNYADYLDGVWKEYQAFRGVKRDDTPKPVVAPVAEDVPTNPEPKELPEPMPAEPIDEAPVPATSPTPAPVPVPVPTPAPAPVPVVPASPVAAPSLEFSFYGAKLKAAEMKTYQLSSLNESSIASTWKKYQKDNNKDVLSSLKTLAAAYGLNDWFTVEMVRSYVDALLRNGGSNDRMVLQHYLIAHMGYDARIARTDRQIMLLLPFKQLMYERSFLRIDNKEYYIFYDNIAPIHEEDASFYSCEIPKDADAGSKVSLLFNSRSLKMETGMNKECVLTDGRIRVKATVNKGMMEMLRHYPPMDIPCYAQSEVLPPLHQSIIDQIKPQVAGMSKAEAANTLLHFVQNAFEYATDDEQHGYEKAYFLEENFYYPKNDCEDRAIFYSFLVRYALGLDVHLIQYPGHECTAVHFDVDIPGDYYMFKGKRYMICDPTYIGANIGMCMPMYQNASPEVSEW